MPGVDEFVVRFLRHRELVRQRRFLNLHTRVVKAPARLLEPTTMLAWPAVRVVSAWPAARVVSAWPAARVVSA